MQEILGCAYNSHDPKRRPGVICSRKIFRKNSVKYPGSHGRGIYPEKNRPTGRNVEHVHKVSNKRDHRQLHPQSSDTPLHICGHITVKKRQDLRYPQFFEMREQIVPGRFPPPQKWPRNEANNYD